MIIYDSSILQTLVTFYLTFHHCFYMQSKFRHINPYVSKLSQFASLFTFFKSGNNLQNPRKLFIRNIIIFTMFNTTSVLFDNTYRRKFIKNPLLHILRWSTMSITLKNDTIDFLGKFNAHLWFLSNEFLFTLMVFMSNYYTILVSFILTSVFKMYSYKEIPENLDIFESHELKKKLKKENTHKQFLYEQNHSPLATAPAFLLGVLARRHGIVFKSTKLPKFFDFWAIYSYLFHTQFVFKLLPTFDMDPFKTTIITNMSTFISSFILYKIIHKKYIS